MRYVTRHELSKHATNLLRLQKVCESHQHGLNVGNIVASDEAVQRINDHDLWVELGGRFVHHRQLHFKACKRWTGRLKVQQAFFYPLL